MQSPGSNGPGQLHFSGSALHSTPNMSPMLRPAPLHSCCCLSGHPTVLASPILQCHHCTWALPLPIASSGLPSGAVMIPHGAKPQLLYMNLSILALPLKYRLRCHLFCPQLEELEETNVKTIAPKLDLAEAPNGISSQSRITQIVE